MMVNHSHKEKLVQVILKVTPLQDQRPSLGKDSSEALWAEGPGSEVARLGLHCSPTLVHTIQPLGNPECMAHRRAATQLHVSEASRPKPWCSAKKQQP